MRKIRFAAVVMALALASCAVPDAWEGTPNPLDTPAVEVERPEAMGRFGAHSEFYR